MCEFDDQNTQYVFAFEGTKVVYWDEIFTSNETFNNVKSAL